MDASLPSSVNKAWYLKDESVSHSPSPISNVVSTTNVLEPITQNRSTSLSTLSLAVNETQFFQKKTLNADDCPRPIIRRHSEFSPAREY